MSVSKNNNGDGIKNRDIKTEKGFINVGKEGTDIEKVNKAYDEFRIITPQSAHANKRRYEKIDTNVSVRNQFSRQDYEYFRPDEKIPSEQKEIIAFCMEAYKKVGLIRNVIDLMADFGCQGIQIVHPNPKIQKFFRGWFKRVNGSGVSERFLNLLYRAGNVVVKRSTIKIGVKDVSELQKTTGDDGDGILRPDMDKELSLKPLKKVIPGKYNFLSPLSIEVIGGELAQFVGRPEYAIKISQKLRRAINNPKTTEDKALIKGLSSEIKKAAKSGQQFIKLDPDKICVHHYKKDDWQVWADPMINSLLDDLMLLEKMKLADLAALDGAISQVRLWRLGSLEHEIFPTDAAVSKLADILISNPGGGAFDLIWGPELDFKESGTNVHQFLGSEKYEPVLNNIYAGLGIPPTLTGSATASGFTNNYISLKTLVQRLEYGRDRIRNFWEKELAIVQKAMGFRFPAQIVFDRMILSDEASEKSLFIQLADRGIISHETLLERFGEMSELESLRSKREHKARQKDGSPQKASPWHNPEKQHDLANFDIQRGIVTPSEVGLDLEERKDGETSPQDDAREAVKKSKEKVETRQRGEPEQGRPRNSRDQQKRETKQVKPRVSASDADFIDKMTWAKSAQGEISSLVTPAILGHYNKKNLRSLSAEEFANLERVKFIILCSLDPFVEVNSELVLQKLKDTTLTMPSVIDKTYNEFLLSFSATNGKDPSIEDLRAIQVSTYALVK